MSLVSSRRRCRKRVPSDVWRCRSSFCESVLFASLQLGQKQAVCHGEEEGPPAFALIVLLPCNEKRVVQLLVTPILILWVGLRHEPVALAEIGENSYRGENNFFRLRVGLLVVCDRIASSKRRLVMPFLVLRASLFHEPVALARIKIFCRGEAQLLPPWISSLRSSG